MIVIDDYSIQEYPRQNRLVISLPQIMHTCTNTVGEIQGRKENINEMEQSIILSIVKSIYQGLYKE